MGKFDALEAVLEKEKAKGEELRKKFGMSELSPETKQLIEDMAQSAPAIGVTKAVGKLTKTAAQKILDKVDTAEKAVALKGAERGKYLEALDKVYGDQAKRAADMGFGPQTYYHGTGRSFEKFDPKYLGSHTGPGYTKDRQWFTDNPETAEIFSSSSAKLETSRKYNDKIDQLYRDQADLYNLVKKDIPKEFNLSDLVNKASERDLNVFKKYGDLTQQNIDDIKKLKQFDVEANQLTNIKRKEMKDVSGNIIPVKLRLPQNLPEKDMGGRYWIESATEIPEGAIKLKNFRESTPLEEAPSATSIGLQNPARIRSEFAAFDPRFKDSPLLMAGALAAPMSTMQTEQPSQVESQTMPQDKPIQSVQETWDKSISGLNTDGWNPNIQYGFTTKPIENFGMSVGSPKQYEQQKNAYPPGNYPMSPMNPEPQQPVGMPQMPQPQPQIDMAQAQEEKMQMPIEEPQQIETPMASAIQGYNQGAKEFGFMKGFDDKQKQFEAKMRESYDQEQRAMQEGIEKMRSYDEKLAQMQPKDYWADKSTGSRIAAAIAMGIGAYASAMTGGPNTAKQIIDDTIQRDIATQRERFNRAKERGAMMRNAYADQVRLYGSQREAEMALQSAYYKNIDQKLKAYETQASTDVQRANIQRLQQQMALDLMKLDQERAQRVGQMELSKKIKAGIEIDPTELSEKDQERYISDPQFGGLAKSKEHQIKFAPMLASYNNATDMIKTLVYISRNGGASMNPDLAKKATTNALMLQGQLKDPVVSSGAVSESERKMLEKIAANPSDFFSLSSSQQSALEEAQRKMDMNIYNQSKVYMSTPARIPVNDVNQATVKLNGKSFVLPRQKLPQLEIDAKRNNWKLEVISGQ